MANLPPGQDAGSRNGRLHIPSYISGYFDGEGCFSVSISPRAQLKLGWEVRPSVSISQNGDRRQVVDLIHAYFGCGSIRPDRSDSTVKWEVRSLLPILGVIIPHFEQWPLMSAKNEDVRKLAHVCRAMKHQRHLSPEGLLEIAVIAASMNPSGARRYSVEEIAASVLR